MGAASRNGTDDLNMVCWRWCNPVGSGGFDQDYLVYDVYASHSRSERASGVICAGNGVSGVEQDICVGGVVEGMD